MKKIVFLALLLFPTLASAQIPSGYVQATATVPILANGSFGAAWTNLSSSPQLGLLGCVSTFQTTVNGTIDSYGKFSVLLADPGQICPAPSTWTFTFSCYTPPGAFITPITVTGGGSIDDITSQILAAAPANICQGGSGGRQLTVETNGAPNLSQTLLNFVDTPTIHFTNPSGGVESATCATATSSTIGCAKPDNSTVTISGGVLSATSAASNVTDFKHAGTLLTGLFAPNAGVQVYDYNETLPAPGAGLIAATFNADPTTGRWNVTVPNPSGLLQMQNTAAPAGQGVFVPFTACTNDNTDPLSLITLQQCDAKSGILQSSTGGIFGHNATGGFIWSGASLPSGLSPSNVTGVYALSNNWTAATSVGITLNCGAGVAESIPSNQQVSVGPLSGITGSNIGTVTCTLQAVQSLLGSYMDLQQTQLGLWVTYTGTPLTQTAILNIGLPLQYSSFNNTLTVGPYWPNGVTALTVATLPSPSAGQDGGTGYPQYLVSDLATPTIGGACTGGGSTYGWCQSNGSGYVVFALQGGGGAGINQLTGDVTAGPGTGSQAATIANNAVTTAKINNAAVTLAKIQNAGANSVLLGAGASGSGAPYTEITLGTNLSMAGTTLNATGGGGDTITSPGATISVGGTSTNTTLDLNLAHANTWTALQTFPSSFLTTTGTSGPATYTGGVLNIPQYTGGGGGSPGGSTGNLQYNNAGSFGGDASTNDDGSGNVTTKTLSTTGTAGAGGEFNATEGTAPSTASGHDILYGDSTSHCMMYSANGGSFTCLGSGGSSTPLVSRVNVLSYGAVADGVVSANTGTDNTTAFTNCLTAAIAAHDYCYVPGGVYRIATSLPTISVGGTGFVGDTWGSATSTAPATVIFSSSSSATILSITSGSYIVGDTLQNINLSRGVAPATGSIALLMNHAAGAWINRNSFEDSSIGMDITNSPGYGVGIIEHNAAGWGYQGVGCGSGPNIGFNLHGGSGVGFISMFLQWNGASNNCGATPTSYGYKADGAIIDLNMSNNQTSLTSYGIYFVGDTGRDVHIVDQTDDSNTINGEYFDYAGGGVTTDLRGGWTTGSSTSGGATVLHNVKGIKVSERQYYDAGGSLPQGIEINSGSTSNAVQNNMFFQPNSIGINCNGANDNNFSNNTFNMNFSAAEAISLVNCSGNTVMANKASGAVSTLISADSNSNNNYYINLNQWDSSGTAISDSGTGNQFIASFTGLTNAAIQWGTSTSTTRAATAADLSSLLYAADTGSANVYAGTLTFAPSGYVNGLTVSLKIANSNTITNPTININSLGPKTITKLGTSPLLAGDILAGTIQTFQYDGTEFQLLNPATSGGGGCIGTIACTNVANSFVQTQTITPAAYNQSALVINGKLTTTPAAYINGVAGSGSPATTTITGVTAGDTLIGVCQTTTHTMSLGTLSDSQGDTYTVVVQDDPYWTTQVFHAFNVHAGTHTSTCSNNSQLLWLFDFTANISGALDGTASISLSTANNPITTTQAGSIVFAGQTCFSTLGTGPNTNAGSFTPVLFDINSNGFSYFQAATPGTYTPAITNVGCSNPEFWTIAFKGTTGASQTADLVQYKTPTGTQVAGVSASGQFTGPLVSKGTTFAISGCSPTSITGGATKGSFLAGATSCAITVTMGDSQAAPNGWICSAKDITTVADLFTQSATTTTTATLSATVVSGDKILVSCDGY